MLLKTSLLLALLLGVIAPGLAAPAKNVPRDDDILMACSAFSQAGMHDCLVKKHLESGTVLKQAQNGLDNALERWDEDAKYVRQARAKVKASHAAFQGYRKAHCASIASLAGAAAGNAQSMRLLACAVELNWTRARQLDRDALLLPAKKP